MKALLAQLTASIGDIQANARRVVDVIGSRPEVELAVFPELYLCGYTYSDLDSIAIEVTHESIRAIQRAAAEAETAAVVGFAERLSKGVGNSVACIDRDGHLVAIYRKILLYGGEREVFTPGTELMLVALAGRVVAPLICFDIEFPEPARKVAMAGAELLVTSSANMAPLYQDHAIAVRARANENRLPHLYANMVGPGDGMTFVGGSRHVSAIGDVITEGTQENEELILCEVPAREELNARPDYLAYLADTASIPDVVTTSSVTDASRSQGQT